jgi:hypothetical protein
MAIVRQLFRGNYDRRVSVDELFPIPLSNSQHRLTGRQTTALDCDRRERDVSQDENVVDRILGEIEASLPQHVIDSWNELSKSAHPLEVSMADDEQKDTAWHDIKQPENAIDKQEPTEIDVHSSELSQEGTDDVEEHDGSCNELEMVDTDNILPNVSINPLFSDMQLDQYLDPPQAGQNRESSLADSHNRCSKHKITFNYHHQNPPGDYMETVEFDGSSFTEPKEYPSKQAAALRDYPFSSQSQNKKTEIIGGHSIESGNCQTQLPENTQESFVESVKCKSILSLFQS